jgi:4-amino-4-deoxy-L-arabinose transferase-like glycosyltransferase
MSLEDREDREDGAGREDRQDRVAPQARATRSPLILGAPTSRADLVVALVIGLLLTAFAFAWRSPLIPTDPWHYIHAALSFPSEDWVPLGFTRYGIILANIPPAHLFGDAEATYYFWPLLSVLVLAAATYLLGRRWFGAVGGLVAVVVLFSNSILLYNLTRGYPDVMSMAVLMSAGVSAVQARDRGFRGRAAVLWLLATGFLLGWGFEVRETCALGWPIVLMLLWRRDTAWRTYAIVAAPVLAWAALDVGISGLVYGDPLLKMHTLLGTNPTGVGNAPPPSPFRVAAADQTRMGYVLSIPKAALASHTDGRWMVVSGVLAMVAVLIPRRPLRVMSFGFIVLYAANLLAGGVLLPHHPFGSLVNPRYWIQYFPFVALVIGGLASVLAAWLLRWARRPSRLARGAVAAAVTVVACVVPVWQSVTYLPTVPAFAANGGTGMEQLRDYLGEHHVSVHQVWTDWQTRRLMPAYQRPFFGREKVWDGATRSLTGEGQPGPGDAVVLYGATGTVCLFCRHALAPWATSHPAIPSQWHLDWTSADGSVQFYRVS